MGTISKEIQFAPYRRCRVRNVDLAELPEVTRHLSIGVNIGITHCVVPHPGFGGCHTNGHKFWILIP